MRVTIEEVSNAMKKLPSGKSPGLDNLSSEHFQCANKRVSVLFALLFTSLFVHNYLPQNMLKSVLVPIVKDKSGNLTDKTNYRPIGLNSLCSKLLERIMLERMSTCIENNDQFGFKANHSTESCIFLLKEILHYFKKHSTTSFIGFMDASKAFDRVNHGKLLKILLERNIPKYLICMMEYWLNRQLLCVRWGSSISEFFSVSNGVRQGGILSPFMFNVYFDEISSVLKTCSVGCYFHGILVNHLMYADDIVLFSPSVKGLQTLIDNCVSVGQVLNITFNELKTVYMEILADVDKTCKVNFPTLYLSSELF